MRKLLSCVILLPVLLAPAARAEEPTAVVAAENFYGDIAHQIGGPSVRVTSILANPDQDPHLFEASPAVARAIVAARLVIYNGLGYDPWIEKLLAAAPNPRRETIAVAMLVGRKAGDNPHIWYDPATMPVLAQQLAQVLARLDPSHEDAYRQHLERFRQSMQPIEAKIAALRRRLSGISVTATEPVFSDMLAALGMEIRNRRFQLAVMNGTEPSASDIAALETDLRMHRVRLLVYNRQAADPTARRMVQLAGAAHIPVVAVTETEPAGTTYQDWIMGELDALDRAFAR